MSTDNSQTEQAIEFLTKIRRFIAKALIIFGIITGVVGITGIFIENDGASSVTIVSAGFLIMIVGLTLTDNPKSIHSRQSTDGVLTNARRLFGHYLHIFSIMLLVICMVGAGWEQYHLGGSGAAWLWGAFFSAVLGWIGLFLKK